MKLIPAILTDDVNQVQNYLNKIEPIEEIELVQIDVLDGQFADNMTVTPLDLVGLDFGHLELDFHLMVQEPMDLVQELIEIKSQLPIRAVIGHVEQMTHQQQFLDEVQKNGWVAGLALDIFTPLTAVNPKVLTKLPLLELLGVEAGFQNQELKPLLFNKIERLSKLDCNQDLELMVDGGVKLEHLEKLLELNVDSIAVGSALLKQEDVQAAAESFLDKIND